MGKAKKQKMNKKQYLEYLRERAHKMRESKIIKKNQCQDSDTWFPTALSPNVNSDDEPFPNTIDFDRNELEAPTLFKAFFKIRPKSFDYCSVCLRAGTETRLVKPKTFKKFIEAIYLDCDFDEKTHVCYMCEQQASSAYKFYKAAMFATTVKQLLKEYLAKRNMGTSELFEKRRFLQLLKKKKLECGEPLEWESQLLKIRTRTEMLHTEVLVIDSLGAQGSTTEKSLFTTEGLSEVYIVPDEPDELMDRMHTITQACTTDNVILIDEDEENQLNNNQQPGPQLVPIQKLLDQPRIHSTEIIYDGYTDRPDPLTLSASSNQLPTTSVTMTQAPSAKELVLTIPADQLPLTTSANKPPTTTDNSTPSGVVGANGNYILHPIVLDKDGNLTVPSLTSTLMNNMIQVPQIAGNNMLQINGTDKNVKLINTNMFQLTQAANNSHVSHVKGVDATNLLNLQIPNNNNRSHIQLPQNIASTNKPNQIFQIHNPANDTIQPLFQVKSDPLNDELNIAADHLKKINDLANEIKSEIGQYNTVQHVNSDVASVNKMSGTKSSAIDNVVYKRSCINPCIQDIHSTDSKMKKKKTVESETEKLPTKKSDRIDWEDKIPMDVISFVDAIDPNADQILKKTPTTSPQYAITQVRSLKTQKEILVQVMEKPDHPPQGPAFMNAFRQTGPVYGQDTCLGRNLLMIMGIGMCCSVLATIIFIVVYYSMGYNKGTIRGFN